MMTEQEWEQLEKSLSQFSSQKLLIDGYEVSLRLERSKLNLVIMVYVDGVSKGKYLYPDTEEEREIRDRFMWHRQKYKYSAKFRKSMKKLCGKREYKKEGYDEKIDYWWMYYESFTTLKRQFKARNKNIKWLNNG